MTEAYIVYLLVGGLCSVIAVLVGLQLGLRARLVRLAGHAAEAAHARAELADSLRDEHIALREAVLQRLAMNQQAQASQLQAFRETLLERFAELGSDMERRLAAGQRQGLHAGMELREALLGQFATLQQDVAQRIGAGQQGQQQALSEHRQRFEQRQGEAIRTLQDVLQDGMLRLQRQVSEVLTRNTEELGQRVDKLTQSTDQRLQSLGEQVERRLEDGFKRTTETFTSVLTHLTRIDEAQKKITELSSNVVSLQEVLRDKRARGSFGEVQLMALVRDLLPETAFAEQYLLRNGKQVDCMLFLPQPTGNVPADSKFPFENYQRMLDHEAAPETRRNAERQFRADVKRHIQAIADKYIAPPETADMALMFVPSESIFAEIHSNFPDLVQASQACRVWLVSPSTLMAILTTAAAVLKDAALREQAHIIQDHLNGLSQEFGRFQERMDRLAKHIRQASDDVEKVHTTARKITSRFQKIERAELSPPATAAAKRGEPPSLQVIEHDGEQSRD